MDIKNRIYKLFSRKKETQKEIEKIQEGCVHKKQNIKFVSLNSEERQKEIRWVCEECEKTLRVPNEKELKTFISK